MEATTPRHQVTIPQEDKLQFKLLGPQPLHSSASCYSPCVRTHRCSGSYREILIPPCRLHYKLKTQLWEGLVTKAEAEEEVAPPLEGGDSRARNKMLQSKTLARCYFRLVQPSRLVILVNSGGESRNAHNTPETTCAGSQGVGVSGA